MAIDLLSYTGNVGLGVGSNAQIPVPGNANLDIINQTGNNIMLMDNQRNMELFRQKIKDRDNLNDMILSDQVATGDILPEYQPYFDEAKKRVEDAFMKWKGNANDTNGLRNYRSAVQDLKDVAAHAQVNTAGIKKMKQEQAKEMLPNKKAEYDRWIGKQMNQPFWNPITPYQQLHDFSIDDILSGVNEFKTVGTDPANPLFKVDQTYVDYEDILKNKRNQYLNDMEAADSIDQFFGKLQQYDPAQLSNTIGALNAQLDQYNKERNLSPGMRGYAAPIQTEAVQGQFLIKEPATDFAAKYALANRQQFVTRSPRFDKDMAKFAIDKEKLKLQAEKLGIDRDKARAYIRSLNTKTDKYLRDQMAMGTDVSKQVEDLINASRPRGITINNIGGVAGNKRFEDVVFTSDLPQSYQYINGPIAAVDRYGKPTGKVTVGRLEPFISKDKKPYWINRYTNSVTGERVTTDSPFIKQTYADWVRQGYKGSVDDLMKTLVKNGGLEVSWQGANGTANLSSLYQSAKAFNAAATTKGEENIMNPPASTPEEPEDEE